MGITILATGSPEASECVRDLAQELIYAMGRTFDLEKAGGASSDALVLSILAVAPSRGTIPNSAKFKRADAEFWSSYNIDFERFASGDARGKVEAVGAALVGAISQVPNSRMSDDEKRQFEAAVSAGAALLLSEPDRIMRFQRPLNR